MYGSDTIIYPCCKTLPMGWSHSPFLAQAAHEHLVDTRTQLHPDDRLRKTSDMRLGTRAVHGICIDDNFIIGCDRQEVLRLQDDYLRVLDTVGLEANQKKTVRPSSSGVEVLGVEFHGENHTWMLHPRKLFGLVRCTEALLAKGSCTGHTIEKLVGKWTWAFLARRPFFSVFSVVYRFIQVADVYFRLFDLWPSVSNYDGHA